MALQLPSWATGNAVRQGQAGQEFNPLSGYGMEMWTPDVAKADKLYSGVQGLGGIMPGLDAAGLGNLYSGGFLNLGDDWSLGYNPFGKQAPGFSVGAPNQAMELYSGFSALSPADQQAVIAAITGGGGGGAGAGGGGMGLFSGLDKADPYSKSSSSSGGTTYSGMDWSKSPVTFDQIAQIAKDLPARADAMTDAIYQKYQRLLKEGAGAGTNAVLNTMAGQGMLGSSESADLMHRTNRGILDQISGAAYDAMVQGEQAKMQVPGLLSEIANLGKISTGTTGSSSSSYQVDPTQKYEILLQLINSGAMA